MSAQGTGRLVVGLPLVVGLALAWAAPARGETANRIVAIVNEDVITQSDVTEQLSQLLEESPSPEPADANGLTMQEVVLRRLIAHRLILQQAKREGITVAGDEVARRLEEIRGRFASEEEFQQSLNDSHLSLERLKEQIREQLMVQRLVDATVRSKIVVSPQEVAKALGGGAEPKQEGERVRASHLLVRVNEGRSEEQARALIEDLHRQLVKGADFATLAKRHSEDPNADDGGMLGWVAQGELLPELDAALFSLTPGQLSAPIQSRLGFHLVRVEERRPAASLSVTEAHRALYQRLYQQKFQEAFSRWLDELKRRAYLVVPSGS